MFSSCAVVGYSITPDQAWDARRPEKPIVGKLFYSVQDNGGLSFGGLNDLRILMKNNRAFDEVEQVSEMPPKGLYVKVTSLYRDPSAGAMVWGYVAASLLLILPAYSGSSGFYAQYHVFRDGQKVKFYEYEIRRKAFAWLPVLPFFWINFLTSSEEEAFEATTNQFFKEAIADGSFAEPAHSKL